MECVRTYTSDKSKIKLVGEDESFTFSDTKNPYCFLSNLL